MRSRRCGHVKGFDGNVGASIGTGRFELYGRAWAPRHVSAPEVPAQAQVQ
jgi:hypothetical protein